MYTSTLNRTGRCKNLSANQKFHEQFDDELRQYDKPYRIWFSFWIYIFILTYLRHYLYLYITFVVIGPILWRLELLRKLIMIIIVVICNWIVKLSSSWTNIYWGPRFKHVSKFIHTWHLIDKFHSKNNQRQR